MREHKVHAGFIEPMLLLRTERLPEGPVWLYELLGPTGTAPSRSKSGGKVQHRSRNDNDFSARYPGIVKALASIPDTQ